MKKEEKKISIYFPIGIGFIGMAIPLFISTFYAPTEISKICEMVSGFIFLGLGSIMLRIKEE